VHGIENYYKLLVLWVCRPAGYLYEPRSEMQS